MTHPNGHCPWLGICFRRSSRGCCTPPSVRQERLTGLACGLFIFYLACCLIVRPYANRSKFSYITTRSYTTNTILPGLRYASVYTIQLTAYSLQSTFYSLQFTVFSFQSSVHSLQPTVYSLHYTVYSLQSTVYIIQFTVYSLPSTVYSL